MKALSISLLPALTDFLHFSLPILHTLKELQSSHSALSSDISGWGSTRHLSPSLNVFTLAWGKAKATLAYLWIPSLIFMPPLFYISSLLTSPCLKKLSQILHVFFSLSSYFSPDTVLNRNDIYIDTYNGKFWSRMFSWLLDFLLGCLKCFKPTALKPNSD